MAAREARAGQSYECFPDIPFEEVMAELFRAKGMATLYMRTKLTPPDQTAADPGLHPCSAPEGCRHYEYKGWDWMELAQLIAGL